MPKAPKRSSALETYHAIFAVDPGNHTGVAWSLVPDMGSIKGSLLARLGEGSATLTGDELCQAVELFGLWQRFRSDAFRSGIPDSNVHLVIERFTLRGGQHAAGRDGTSPERMAWAFEGYRFGRYSTYRKKKSYIPITWQNPADHAFATRPRLESWGCWVVGREHERTAYGHLAFKLSKLLKVRAR